MILVMDGNVKIDGSGVDIIAETSILLKAVRETAAEKLGEEQADIVIALIGRLAMKDAGDFVSGNTDDVDELLAML